MIKVHLFTLLQILGLVVLWAIKSYKPASIVFPLMVAAIVGIRKVIEKVPNWPKILFFRSYLSENILRFSTIFHDFSLNANWAGLMILFQSKRKNRKKKTCPKKKNLSNRTKNAENYKRTVQCGQFFSFYNKMQLKITGKINLFKQKWKYVLTKN